MKALYLSKHAEAIQHRAVKAHTFKVGSANVEPNTPPVKYQACVVW